MKQNYRYIERETEKAFLLLESGGYFWIPKNVAEVHPRYKFLAKPFTFFKPEIKNRFKKWKRKSLANIIPFWTVEADCRWCDGGLSLWVDNDYKIGQTTKLFCEKCKSKFNTEELSIRLDFIDGADAQLGHRTWDFIKSKHLVDYETFMDPYITIKGQLEILDQDMRERGGYYEDGALSSLEKINCF